MGCCAHAAHGRHLYHWCLDKFGDMNFDIGDEILVDAPLYKTIIGKKPKTLKDLSDEGLRYLEEESSSASSLRLIQAKKVTSMDFESKALHTGDDG